MKMISFRGVSARFILFAACCGVVRLLRRHSESSPIMLIAPTRTATATSPTRYHSLPTVVEAIGLHHLGTNVQPMDVMSCEELNSTSLSNFTASSTPFTAQAPMRSRRPDPNTGGGPDGLIYRTHTVQVVSARPLLTGQTVLLTASGTYTAAHSPGGAGPAGSAAGRTRFTTAIATAAPRAGSAGGAAAASWRIRRAARRPGTPPR